MLPAGDYSVETDEELLDTISFPAYRRILTVIRLPAKSGNPLLARALTIDPKELDAALMRDQEPTKAPMDVDANQKKQNDMNELHPKTADDQAMERAEDDGMMARLR